jgi:hypothetical protein
MCWSGDSMFATACAMASQTVRHRWAIQLAERVGLLRPSWPQALRARRCAPSKIAPGDFVEPACRWFVASNPTLRFGQIG